MKSEQTPKSLSTTTKSLKDKLSPSSNSQEKTPEQILKSFKTVMSRRAREIGVQNQFLAAKTLEEAKRILKSRE